MVSIEDADPNALIAELAKELEAVEQIVPPEWAKFVKTGVHKERPPVQENWWHIRAAAVLRTIHLRGPVGVAKLRSKYGGKKNRGTKPEIFQKGSGNILRKILQQLDTAGFTKKAEKGRGRVIQPSGQALLQKISNKVGIRKLTEKPVKLESRRAKGAAPAQEGAQKQAAPKEQKKEKKEEKPAEKNKPETAKAV